ncbi:5'-3' exonuclease [Cupriavidus basilensis]|uniref:5'-3' exonuclease n=1 Tax=Cupriavidus TaxID=106589 RepID=UPI0004482DBB|nr:MULTISPECIES: 5'-3' exonuclease H3TH domain-containing protein [Cupriavidus]KDP84501.1 5'-3' exonuclease [Cupriavidus sp. SK-3]MDF3888008.1 5'-3' exonuclease H3TH domain-containing protein [Cupriavidus basilensis]
MKQTLLLIDGLNILRRVYEANPSEDIPAKVEGAVLSALASFRRALAECRPTHALAAFDAGGKTWRHALYPQYRQHRKPMDPELADVIPDFRLTLTEVLGLQTASADGYEADDIIATVFYRWTASKEGQAIPVSTDKDVLQLIADGAIVRNHFATAKNGEPSWFDESYVMDKFGVGSHQLADYLAMLGDSTDGIPGVEKIGAKTAVKLLQRYGDLETVLANASGEKGVIGKNLAEQAHLARLSRQLLSLKTDVQLGLTWNMLRIGDAAGDPP